jgi:nicotinamidase-related amidase
LQSSGVSRVIVAGVATLGTVLSTARWAYDVGYEVTVCADACDDPDPQATWGTHMTKAAITGGSGAQMGAHIARGCSLVLGCARSANV